MAEQRCTHLSRASRVQGGVRASTVSWTVLFESVYNECVRRALQRQFRNNRVNHSFPIYHTINRYVHGSYKRKSVLERDYSSDVPLCVH